MNQGDRQRDGRAAAPSGRRLAVTLLVVAGSVPVLTLGYALAAAMIAPDTAATSLRHLVPLFLAALLVAAVGGFVIWDATSPLTRDGAGGGPRRPLPAEPASADGNVMTNAWNRMLSTIERQTDELNRFSTRLDNAYEELETANVRLRDLSFKDELTRLYNRRFFSARLEEEIARHRRFAHPISLVLIDVDGFKAVNDELGHAAGDETLRGVADILLKHSRGIDVIGRHGGDEFAVLLVEAPRAGARQYAERIRRLLAVYPFSHGRRVTASFGVASLPEDTVASGDALFQAADEALYAAKRAGKDQVRTAQGAAAVQERQAV